MARSWDSNSSHFEPSLSTDAQPAAGEGRPTAVGRTALPCAPSVADVTDDRVFVMTANPGVRRWRALDYITQRLLPHIDGRRRVDELARSAELDPALTRLALLQLARAGVVRSVPSPSFLRVAAAGADGDGGAIVTPGWIGLPRLSKLLTDPMLAEACIQTSVSQLVCVLLLWGMG